VSARLLVVAGHDPGGGAGVAADREAAARFGVDAHCVVTAWTDQANGRVRAVGARPAAEWASEAERALAAAPFPFGALKSGLLPDADAVRALAALCERFASAGRPVVVDPVLAASGGEPFLDEAGVECLRSELIPRAVVLTPNLIELARLGHADPDRLAGDRGARVEAARQLLEAGARAVLVKAGHGEGPADDLLVEAGRPPRWFTRPRVPGAALHGSGCRHASALAAHLAHGATLESAALGAARYLADLLASGGGG
jgi:hydroxymethylpyrimidine/phosphomethylpyrimidine kinase